jgi:hypothetical protein
VPDVRAYAFEKIGEVAGPEAIEFLEQVKREDFGPDTVSRVWPAAQVAIRIAPSACNYGSSGAGPVYRTNIGIAVAGRAWQDRLVGHQRTVRPGCPDVDGQHSVHDQKKSVRQTG